jgi:G3E family GTPase
VRVNLLFGFLGSGKTTLVRRLLETRTSDRPMAVIVNEFGDVSIDGQILEGRSVDMVELTSGCVCCTLKGSLLNAIEELEERAGVEQIVVEATGVAQPSDMLDTLDDPSLKTTLELGPLVTVVDAAKFAKIRTMLGEFYSKQVAHADKVLLNKTDLVSAETLDEVQSQIRALNPHGEILFTEHCDVDPSMVLDGASTMARHEHSALCDHGHDEHEHPAPADSFVLAVDGDWGREGLEQFFQNLSDHVWRVKGFMQIDGEPSLVQYTMGQLDITACEPRANAHLVFIGKPLGRDRIARALERASGFADQENPS